VIILIIDDKSTFLATLIKDAIAFKVLIAQTTGSTWLRGLHINPSELLRFVKWYFEWLSTI
jgi:hypothetical protein